MHRDLLALQAFGGWSSVDQVQVYTHLLLPAYARQAAEWLGLAPAARSIAVDVGRVGYGSVYLSGVRKGRRGEDHWRVANGLEVPAASGTFS